MAAVLLSPLSLAAQTKGSAPRTPDGRPDLQGMWTNATYTPLAAAANLGTKAFYTDEELAEVERRRLAAGSRGETEPGTAADVHYDFAQFGLEQRPGRRRAKQTNFPDRRPARREDSSRHR